MLHKIFLVLNLLFCFDYIGAKHYLLYTRPSHEVSFMDSYYYSQHLCSIDFVNPPPEMLLRNATDYYISDRKNITK
jgi:hypothetical protein